jgi:hypothetical protein
MAAVPLRTAILHQAQTRMSLPNTNTGHLLEEACFPLHAGTLKQYPTYRPVEDIKVLTSDGSSALSTRVCAPITVIPYSPNKGSAIGFGFLNST